MTALIVVCFRGACADESRFSRQRVCDVFLFVCLSSCVCGFPQAVAAACPDQTCSTECDHLRLTKLPLTALFCKWRNGNVSQYSAALDCERILRSSKYRFKLVSFITVTHMSRVRPVLTVRTGLIHCDTGKVLLDFTGNCRGMFPSCQVFVMHRMFSVPLVFGNGGSALFWAD